MPFSAIEKARQRAESFSGRSSRQIYLAACALHSCRPSKFILRTIVNDDCDDRSFSPNGVLDLSPTVLGARGARAVMDLMWCQPMWAHTLNLRGCGLDDLACRDVIEIIRDHPNIRSVDLSDNPDISIESSAELCSAVKGNENIVHVNLQNTHVGDNVWLAISRLCDKHGEALEMYFSNEWFKMRDHFFDADFGGSTGAVPIDHIVGVMKYPLVRDQFLHKLELTPKDHLLLDKNGMMDVNAFMRLAYPGYKSRTQIAHRAAFDVDTAYETMRRNWTALSHVIKSGNVHVECSELYLVRVRDVQLTDHVAKSVLESAREGVVEEKREELQRARSARRAELIAALQQQAEEKAHADEHGDRESVDQSTDHDDDDVDADAVGSQDKEAKEQTRESEDEKVEVETDPAFYGITIPTPTDMVTLSPAQIIAQLAKHFSKSDAFVADNGVEGTDNERGREPHTKGRDSLSDAANEVSVVSSSPHQRVAFSSVSGSASGSPPDRVAFSSGGAGADAPPQRTVSGLSHNLSRAHSSVVVGELMRKRRSFLHCGEVGQVSLPQPDITSGESVKVGRDRTNHQKTSSSPVVPKMMVEPKSVLNSACRSQPVERSSSHSPSSPSRRPLSVKQKQQAAEDKAARRRHRDWVNHVRERCGFPRRGGRSTTAAKSTTNTSNANGVSASSSTTRRLLHEHQHQEQYHHGSDNKANNDCGSRSDDEDEDEDEAFIRHCNVPAAWLESYRQSVPPEDPTEEAAIDLTAFSATEWRTVKERQRDEIVRRVGAEGHQQIIARQRASMMASSALRADCVDERSNVEAVLNGNESPVRQAHSATPAHPDVGGNSSPPLAPRPPRTENESAVRARSYARDAGRSCGRNGAGDAGRRPHSQPANVSQGYRDEGSRDQRPATQQQRRSRGAADRGSHCHRTPLSLTTPYDGFDGDEFALAASSPGLGDGGAWAQRVRPEAVVIGGRSGLVIHTGGGLISTVANSLSPPLLVAPTPPSAPQDHLSPHRPFAGHSRCGPNSATGRAKSPASSNIDGGGGGSLNRQGATTSGAAKSSMQSIQDLVSGATENPLFRYHCGGEGVFDPDGLSTSDGGWALPPSMVRAILSVFETYFNSKSATGVSSHRNQNATPPSMRHSNSTSSRHDAPPRRDLPPPAGGTTSAPGLLSVAALPHGESRTGVSMFTSMSVFGLLRNHHSHPRGTDGATLSMQASATPSAASLQNFSARSFASGVSGSNCFSGPGRKGRVDGFGPPRAKESQNGTMPVEEFLQCRIETAVEYLDLRLLREAFRRYAIPVATATVTPQEAVNVIEELYVALRCPKPMTIPDPLED